MKILIKEGQFKALIETLNYGGSIGDFIMMKRGELKKMINDLDGTEGFDDYQFDSAVDGLIRLQKILRKGGDLELYRVISAKNESSIDLSNLGNHFTYDKNIYEDVASVFDIGFKKGDKFYMITISTSPGNIDIQETIEANINYPFEREIYLGKFDGVKVIRIEPFEISLPSYLNDPGNE